MKKFEYKEPEFMIVQANCEDILTASGGLLSSISGSWDTATQGGGVGFTFTL